LIHERCVHISHETGRIWQNRFGPLFAREIRKRRFRQLRQVMWGRWHPNKTAPAAALCVGVAIAGNEETVCAG
jgi:hypothetical protein